MKCDVVFSSVFATVLIAFMALGTLFVPTSAKAQWAVECVNCSTTWTQLVQYAQEAETALNTAQQLQTQISQYNEMVKQGLALPSQVWGNVQSDLNNLNGIVSQGSNIAYATSGLSSKFTDAFPNYQEFLSGKTTPQSVQQKLQDWTQQTYDAARTSLQGAQKQSEQITGDEATQLTDIQQASAGATGQMAAIQAGNEMAAMQVQQMQKLRQLVMMQMNMQAQMMAAQARQQAANAAIAQSYVVDPNTVVKPSENWPSAPTVQ